MVEKMRQLALAALLGLAGLASGQGQAEEGKGEGKPAEAKPVTASGRYVHHWVAMPGFSAAKIGGDGDQERIEPQAGRLLVVIFLASWCEPCQQMIAEVHRLEAHYQRLPTDFVYVFAHDTKDDALGFMKEFKLDRAYLANQDVLKTYHNPELPSIYLGDRHGWMLKRWLSTKAGGVAELEGMLKTLASY